MQPAIEIVFRVHLIKFLFTGVPVTVVSVTVLATVTALATVTVLALFTIIVVIWVLCSLKALALSINGEPTFASFKALIPRVIKI